MKRIEAFLVLAAAVTIQICLGGVYAWSAIVGTLQREFALSSAHGQLIFGTTIATFTVVMVFAGRLLERYGPRRITTVGALLFAGGYLIAACSRGEFLLLLLGIGLVVGAGIGCAYVCPLATAVRWFPRHRGLVTGLTVAGMGAGAIVLAALVTKAHQHGLPILSGFAWLGLGYGAIIFLCGQLLSFPVAQCDEQFPCPSAHRFWQERRFWGMAIGMFCGTFAGLLVVGNLKPMGLSWRVAEGTAILAISLFSVGNALGRIVWGSLADRFGAPAMIVTTLLLGAAGLVLLPVLSATGTGFLLNAVLIALAFGGCFVLFAAHVSACYGAQHLPVIYPCIFLAYGLAALLGPVIGGWLFDRTHSYLPALYIAVALNLGGVIAFLLLNRTKTDPPHPQVYLPEFEDTPDVLEVGSR